MNHIPMRLNGRSWPSGSLLATIPAGERDAFLLAGTLREFQAGDVLVFEGDRSTYVHLLLDGVVKVTAGTEDGRTALLAIRVGGDLVGELAGLDDEPRSATVTAAGPTITSYLSQSDFRAFLDDHPALWAAVSAAIAAKLRWATRRRTDFNGRDVPTRLARVLLELARGYGVATAKGTAIDVRVTQSELAALIGAAEISVNRRLADLRAAGAVTTGHGYTTIVDADLLHQHAGLPPKTHTRT